MVDLDHVGNKVCTDLQKEFPPNDVQFLEVDVTDGDQLVGVILFGIMQYKNDSTSSI